MLRRKGAANRRPRGSNRPATTTPIPTPLPRDHSGRRADSDRSGLGRQPAERWWRVVPSGAAAVRSPATTSVTPTGTVALCHRCTRRNMIGMLDWSDGECKVVECDAEPVSAGGVGWRCRSGRGAGSARRRDRRRGPALSGGVSARASAGSGPSAVGGLPRSGCMDERTRKGIRDPDRAWLAIRGRPAGPSDEGREVAGQTLLQRRRALVEAIDNQQDGLPVDACRPDQVLGRSGHEAGYAPVQERRGGCNSFGRRKRMPLI